MSLVTTAMSSAEIRDKETGERLRIFSCRAAALQQRTIDHDQSNLLLFFKKASSFLPIVKPVLAKPVRPVVDFDRLSTVLSHLQKPLRATQQNGSALNVWAVAGLRRNELRNAAVLAWFLDPRGSHGLGSALLTTLLHQVVEAHPGWIDVSHDLSRVAVHTEEWPLGSEVDRVDIALDGPDFSIFIEVKIDAPEGLNQLQRYADLACVKAAALGKMHGRVIFLSSRLPRSLPLGVAVVTWRAIARALASLPRGNISTALAGQFADHVRAF